MVDDLRRCLEDLESRISAETEDALVRDWRGFADGRFAGDIFSPRRLGVAPAQTPWPRISVNAALDDFDAMALQQYRGCSEQLEQGSGALMSVRCNWGTSIIPLLFGVELFLMPEELDTLPTSRPLHDIEAIRRIVHAGVPDLRTGYGSRVLEMGERFVQIGREYPNVGRYVHVYHPDLQGPMDICEIVWGSSIFYALYDEPALVHNLLEVVTATYIAFMREWTKIVPFCQDGNCHWGLFHRGSIVLRDDSAMNLSPAQFDEYMRPYDQRLLDEFGGGVIHFCGRGDHYIASLSDLRGLTAVNMSQPECNDMDVIYDSTVDKGLKLIGFSRQAAEVALSQGRDLHGCVHCS